MVTLDNITGFSESFFVQLDPDVKVKIVNVNIFNKNTPINGLYFVFRGDEKVDS